VSDLGPFQTPGILTKSNGMSLQKREREIQRLEYSYITYQTHPEALETLIISGFK